MHNYGAYQLSTFGYLTKAPEYLCKYEANGAWESCQRQEICAEDSVISEYKFDTSSAYYMNNFFTEMDMTCWSQSSISMIVRMQFFGFLFGIPLFIVLEKWGRIRALNMVIPLSILGSYLSLETSSYWLMCLGYLFQGMAHIKKPLSFGFPNDNCDPKNANIAMGIMLAIDVMTLGVFCSLTLLVTRDTLKLLKVINMVAAICILVIPFLMNESPTWLIANNKNK